MRGLLKQWKKSSAKYFDPPLIEDFLTFLKEQINTTPDVLISKKLRIHLLKPKLLLSLPKRLFAALSLLEINVVSVMLTIYVIFMSTV